MLIKAKVFPSSKKRTITKKSEYHFEIRVKAMPKNGEANKEVIEVLSFYFDLPKEKIRLVSGFRQRNKIFDILI